MRFQSTSLLFLVSFVFLLLGTTAEVRAQKLGHVNTQQIMEKMPEREKAQKKMQSFTQRLRKDIQQMNSEYQNRMTEFQENQETMTETEKQREQEQLAELQKRITQAQQKAQQDLQKQRQELLQPIMDKVDQAVQSIAEEKGYTYVFDAGAGNLLYQGGGKDLTSQVEEELGLTAQSASPQKDQQ